MSNNNTMKTKYWFNDLNELVHPDKYMFIMPNTSMSYPEKVNAFIRLSILIGVAMSIINLNYLYFYIPVLAMIVSYIVYLYRLNRLKVLEAKLKQERRLKQIENNNRNINKNISNAEKAMEELEEFIDTDNVTNPTENNPFMNPLPFDDRMRGPATNYLNDPVKNAEVETLYEKYMPTDPNNIFDRNNGAREFFTLPTTTYPSDQKDFAMWLYGTPPTCKEGNGAQCVANNHNWWLNASSYKLGSLI